MQRGGGIPDPDAPSDAESTRFWCTTGSKFTDREKLEMIHGNNSSCENHSRAGGRSYGMST